MNHGVNLVKYLCIVLLTQGLFYLFSLPFESIPKRRTKILSTTVDLYASIGNTSAVTDLMAFTVCRICNSTNCKFLKIISL